MHEGDARLGQDRAHQPDLGDRGGVKAGHARLDQGLDDPARRVRLNGVEDVGLQIVLEPARRYGNRARPHEGDRTLRGPLADQVQGKLVRAQFT